MRLDSPACPPDRNNRTGSPDPMRVARSRGQILLLAQATRKEKSAVQPDQPARGSVPRSLVRVMVLGSSRATQPFFSSHSFHRTDVSNRSCKSPPRRSQGKRLSIELTAQLATKRMPIEDTPHGMVAFVQGPPLADPLGAAGPSLRLPTAALSIHSAGASTNGALQGPHRTRSRRLEPLASA